jgi:hypothetical protein
MYEYIGIVLGARPILHISRIKVNSTLNPLSPSEQIGSRLGFKDLFDLQNKDNLIRDGPYVDSN